MNCCCCGGSLDGNGDCANYCTAFPCDVHPENTRQDWENRTRRMLKDEEYREIELFFN